jgi:predicted P-loop ATPase
MMFARKDDEMSGLIIPYRWPGDGYVREYRLRRDHSPDGRKYVSAPGRGNLIYVPPEVTTDALLDVRLPIVITEGEFKSLALHRAATYESDDPRYLALGLSGVWNWRGTIGKETGPDGSRHDLRGVIPDFNRVAWRDRRVTIAFDADIVRKPAVKAARSGLIRELAKRGAQVRIVEWPESDGKGVDDLLANVGPKSFVERLENAQPGFWRSELIVAKDGTPKALLANACTALRSAPEWEGVLAYNEFSFSVTTTRETCYGARAGSIWNDHDDRLATEWMQRQGIHVSVEIAAHAVQTVAHENRFHPVRDYLNALEWDRAGRVSTWLNRYVGVESGDYASAVGKCWLISAVARVFEPGVKADCCLIFEGSQGIGKSTALEILGGDWFTDEMADLGSKDAALQMKGAWIIELAELDSMNRSDVGRIKAFISRSVDRFRPPYGKRVIESRRECVFAGTVNDHEYLRDASGARRFWPVKCGEIDLEALRLDRDQLWAEAVALYRDRHPWWLQHSDLVQAASVEQEGRFDADPWLSIIARWLSGRIDASVDDVMEHCLEKQRAQWTQSDKSRVGRCFKALGWERYKAGPRTGREWRYRPAVSQ